MIRLLKSLLPAFAVVAALATTAACTREGPAERTGRSIDRAGERVRDTVDPPRGPVERMGRSIDRTVN